ncbi:DMP19 family protein [Flavobacterium cyclinae]|uniref:DMP19 family protein n=1 Tax=Flavobacterium cyclinae TaxID=2895947 RepID=UPI001E505152|nr:DUF4375 domain-containing protein [Flavobacterium cyclinae]UGS21973.1 DMP19 family protein [Flavobacterium cyclinae]
MTKIKNILKLEDEIKIIEAIGEMIWEKKEETDDFSALTDGEKVFVYVDIFEGAMGEGGFSFFFTSEAGDFVEDIIIAYKEIKAFTTAELISKAWSLFPAKTYSTDVEIRRNFIKKADETLIGAWEDLDEQFFSEEGEDIVSLIVDYIKANETEFGA